MTPALRQQLGNQTARTKCDQAVKSIGGGSSAMGQGERRPARSVPPTAMLRTSRGHVDRRGMLTPQLEWAPGVDGMVEGN